MFKQLGKGNAAGRAIISTRGYFRKAMTAEDEKLGEVRMLAAAQLVREKSAEEIPSAIFRCTDAFFAGTPQPDDMTMLIMELSSEETTTEVAS